eukprot:gene14946-20105_t
MEQSVPNNELLSENAELLGVKINYIMEKSDINQGIEQNLYHDSNQHEQIVKRNTKENIIERKLNLALVHQILPPKIADALKYGRHVPAELFDEVTIFFSDVVGFTSICSQVKPFEVMRLLNELYTVMDYCTSHFPLYKVETIGDAYMVVGGLPARDINHAPYVADFAVLVNHAVKSVKSPVDGSPINIRIGIHSGSVMAGVVGNMMPRYCLFGDTVNTASRMESNGLPNKIHCSEATAKLLKKGGRHELSLRGDIEVKGKGAMTTYWLDSASNINDICDSLAIQKLQLNIDDILCLSSNDENEIDDDHHVFSSSSNSVASEESMCNNNYRWINILRSNSDGADNNNSSNNNIILENNNNNDFKDYSNNNSNHNILKSSENNTPSKQSPFPGLYSLSRTPSIGNNNIMSSPKKSPFMLHRHVTEKFNKSKPFIVNIMVVEDSISQRKMLVQKLSKADPTWDITCAVDGEDALQKLKAAKLMFDVVFVDENLSSNDGLYGHELTEVMRKQFNMQHCVIIACTSNVEKSKSEMLLAGVDIVWPKPPPSIEIIKLTINELLQEKAEQINSSSLLFH